MTISETCLKGGIAIAATSFLGFLWTSNEALSCRPENRLPNEADAILSECTKEYLPIAGKFLSVVFAGAAAATLGAAYEYYYPGGHENIE